MAYPSTPIPVRAEMQTSDGTWRDITTDVIRDGLAITRGKADEASQADPSKCQATLDNRAGTYSPRLPTGAYYGLLGRNTPFRVSVTTQGDKYLLVDGTGGGNASTPDSVALSFAGDIELIVDVDFAAWRDDLHSLGRKWTTTGNQRTWLFELLTDGRIKYWWSADGTAELNATSTIPVPFVTGRHTIKVTHDVNNGAAGNTVTFYYADAYAGPFTQLGDPVVAAGVTSLFNSTAVVFVYAADPAKYYRMTVKEGIGGTTRADPNFTTQTAGAGSFSDGTNTWTVNSGAAISDRDWRFHGEISQWPTRWDKSARDRYVPIVANGVLRRLLQGDPVQSTAYRALANDPTVKAYWPMEDGADATEFAPAVGRRAMSVNLDRPDFASYLGFNCSKPIATCTLNSDLRGTVDVYTSTGSVQARGLIRVPDTGMTNDVEIMSINVQGTAGEWQVRYATGGSLTIRAFDKGYGTSLVTNGPTAFAVDGKELLISLAMVQNGANIDYELVTWEVENDTSGSVVSGTLLANTVLRATRFQWNPNGGTDGMVVGHASIQNAKTSIFARSDELKAYVGETAAERIQRLCTENGVAVRIIGGTSDSPAMGPQSPKKLVDLLRECADIDGGALYEARDFNGLEFRPRSAMWGTQANATMPYASSGIQQLNPEEDDMDTVNDVTATRTDGGSAHVSDESTSNMSVATIGRYHRDYSLNAYLDSQLEAEAGWRLNLGLYDGARFPLVAFDFGNRDIYSSVAKWVALSDLECGQRLLITDPPIASLPPDDVDLVVWGYREFISNFQRQLDFNASPGVPWRVGTHDSSADVLALVDRYDATGSGVNGAHTSTTTTLSVKQTTTTDILWSTDAADHPRDIMVAGEQMTNTATAGTTSPQSMTVVRSVNGVVKAHVDGAVVELHDPIYYGV